VTGHLIHVGYPKAGSTFLQRWFAAHPQLAFTDRGIAGLGDVYAIVRDGVAPRSGLLYRVTSYEGLVAPHAQAGRDVVVDYDSLRQVDMPSSQAAVCTMLADLFPNAVVLMVTRGFRSMILSSYSEYVRSGGDADLADLIAASTARAAGQDHSSDLEPQKYGHLIGLDPWNYDRTIDLYSRAFGRERVIVLPYELLRDDADGFTRELEARLGLAHFAASPERVNLSLSPAEMYWFPRLTRAMRAWPIGSRLRRLYLRGAFTNRFRRPIAMLERLRPGKPVTADAIPDELLEAFRGQAESLRGNPLYAPYERDYLL
jgi:hypothetical protein